MSSVVDHEKTQTGSILSGAAELRGFPDWFRDQQHAAWDEFESLPQPTRKNQAWRFSNVGLLDLAPFKTGPPLSEDDRKNILKYSRGLEQYAGRMVFANDQLVERDVVSDDLKKRGVIFQPLERAMVEHADLFRKYFMSTEAKLGSAKFAALHKALVSSGTFLFVPRGLEIELPIEIFHWLRHDNMSVFPHLLLVADELAKVTVIEHFRSCSRTAPGFACGVNDLIAGPGAKVTYVCAQEWASNVIALQMNSTVVDHDASAMSLNLHVGAKYSRFESLSRLVGEGGRKGSARIRCAHPAGPHLAAHRQRLALQKRAGRPRPHHLRRSDSR
jgi:Fe-S cluster assembly protein SufD